MFRRKSTDEGSNFWISYADLMAGLLFVFILLIGAIVSKSMILKNDLHTKEDRLTQLSSALQSREKTLEALSANLQKNKALLSQREKDLFSKNRSLEAQMHTIQLKEAEIKKLTRMLLEANTQKDRLAGKLVIVQHMLNDTNATLNRKLRDYKGKIVVLSSALSDANQTIRANEAQLLKLASALDEKQTKYDALIEKLQHQRAKIKSLTGIRLKVIAALKDALGNKVRIDKKSGALKLASNVLFDKGSAVLKEDAKGELKRAFEEYIGTLVTNPSIKPYLDKIIIEGHTDSDGGYLYNLDLSQRRAFAVMHYLLTLDIAKKYNLKPLLVVSGRAYLDPVKVNGVEDKEASRRIEIKFRLKNRDAMHEIEKVLDAQ